MLDSSLLNKGSADQPHCAVIGDGVIGLLTSLELLKRGYQVTLLGRGFGEGQASWVSGGILSPLCPWQAEIGVQSLWAWSCDLYPELKNELLEFTNTDIELIQKGMMMLDAPDQDQISSWVDLAKRRCVKMEREEVMQRIPLLDTSFDQAHYLPLVRQLRPLRLMMALMSRLQQFSQFRAIVPAQVEQLVELSSGEIEINVQGGFLRVDQMVVCAGAWTNQVLSLLGRQLPIIPVKGQMMLLDGEGIQLSCIVIKNSKYLIPRLDGGIIVGSTIEEGVDDVLFSEQAESVLKSAAFDLLPALADQKIRHQWAGVRPGSPNGIPYIGRLPGYQSLWVNAGHYRNGINMAPGSARLLTQLMCGDSPAVDPQPYELNHQAG